MCVSAAVCPCPATARDSAQLVRDDHLHSFQSARAIICGHTPSPRHKHIASHPPPLTPPSERTQHMAHEHLWGRRGAVVSACMQRAAYGPRAPACSAEVAPRAVAPVGKARRRGERLHAEVAPRPVAPVAISGNQRRSKAISGGNQWPPCTSTRCTCGNQWQSVAISGNQWRQSVAPLHLEPLHLVRSGRGSRATLSLCRGRSTGNWRSARPRS
jgi:hypothetical protein